jgi:hypothetical protein
MEQGGILNETPFFRVREWVVADLEASAKKAAAAEFPPIAAIRLFAGKAFESAYAVVIKALANLETEPFPLVHYFLTIDECQKRFDTFPDKIGGQVWPGTPGHSFGGYSGNSALQILQAFTRAVYSALMITLGYSKSNDRFPEFIEEMPLSGPRMTDQLRGWPARAVDELTAMTVARATVWEFRVEAGKIWSIFLDENDRAEKKLLELESMAWLTLRVFGTRTPGTWADHPRYRDRAQALESRLRDLATRAGIISVDADVNTIYQNVSDRLVAQYRVTPRGADAMPVAEVVDLLDSGRLGRTLEPPKRRRKLKAKRRRTRLPKIPTSTERRIFELLCRADGPRKGTSIDHELRLAPGCFYRAVGFLKRRRAVRRTKEGYIAIVATLPTNPTKRAS